ncbi:MAG: bifunctional homocysteine S-methyltransferase/methylenetetrahydrofolate reductase [Desulfurivibrio sp.]|nr:bifunctional homocysteine S-methyltransferase/methylenetetrahydrofolate reductase [Desulfurivibrio sp.]
MGLNVCAAGKSRGRSLVSGCFTARAVYTAAGLRAKVLRHHHDNRDRQPMKPDFLEYLQEKVILGDGAIGTYLYTKGIELGKDTDRLNLSDPDLIYSLHEEYIRAGSQLIETNTFGANRLKLLANGLEGQAREINLAGARIAKRAAGEHIYVAGSVGPTGVEFPLVAGEVEPDEVAAAYEEQLSALLEAEVDLLILETFTHLDELLIALKTARRLTSGLPIVAQMAYPAQGRTAGGDHALTCGTAAIAAGASLVGANCGRGVNSMLTAIEALSPLRDQVPLSAFPNAGFPEIVGHRMIYPAQPEYMARVVGEMIKLGARLVGGCCGTSPTHIQEFRKQLKIAKRPVAHARAATMEAQETDQQQTANKVGSLLRELQPDRMPILVELDPPAHLDMSGVLAGAKALAAGGTDAISLGESPLAVLRTENLALAHRIQQEAGIKTIIHLTCRDRNALGLQSHIMGAHLLGIDSILAVTGDPATSSDQPGVSGVFDVRSFGLVRMIDRFNQGCNMAGKNVKQETDFSIGVAFSYRPSKPEVQIKRLERKAALGANYVMTQPFFAAEEVEAMMEKTSHLDLLIFPGIFPLISARNADFLHNEVPGISIPDTLRQQLHKYPQVEDQRRVAMDFTRELVEKIAPFADGLYFISPLNKWEVANELVAMVRQAGWRGSGRVARFAGRP